jgi:hypothetical protein
LEPLACHPSDDTNSRIARDFLIFHTSGTLKAVDRGEANMQTASCWVAVTDDGLRLYREHRQRRDSSYSVSVGGDPSLLNPTAGGGNVPVDAAFSQKSQYLYVRNGGDGTILAQSIFSHGTPPRAPCVARVHEMAAAERHLHGHLRGRW